ncbi:MAG: cytochrome c oxidase accessory protein CcoG [Zoogloeaceae bacterium]|mgnify:CR=1 FL=1|nr:cytochrome c oxidase accessory protein CcoG [Zoogloeaceae bacterium]MCK6385508.1 cytochrome c oxidase accessory protein CcoG [Rhodocyclaceae bacterium]
MATPASKPDFSGAKVIPIREESLYKRDKKIYARSVTGRFANWRWIMVWLTQAIFYGLCWAEWNGRQAVLFDIAERKFYIFGLVFWPQDVFYLAILLILSALALFLFTAVAGRLFCGYACPQTVYTEIFMWVEKLFEGDRVARMKLDAAPWSKGKLARKAGKHAVWALIALWTGFTFVGYFTPVKTLAASLAAWQLGPWETFWVFFYAFATWGNAGFMREQVCKYMCPYARFQGVMFDPDTLIVTYDAERGEPRGARAKKADHRAAGQGDCVDCSICVQVCPTGIDIRDGLQYECIGCSACIDACDQVMDKMNYPRGLIRYSTEHALAEHWGRRQIVAHILRPRTLLYGAILSAIVIAAAAGLTLRQPLKVDVIRDRTTLAREVEGGLIENVYRLQIMNLAEQPRRFALAVTGLQGIQIADERIVEVPAAATGSVSVRVRAEPDAGKRGANPVHFEVRALNHDEVFVREKASFLLP